MASSGYYLLDHPNPHAKPDRDGRYHGYSSRSQPVRVIVIHTAENTPDSVGADGGAEAIARYQARVDRPSSYHDIVDSDSHISLLPWDHTAFHARNANSWSIGLSMATKAALWPSMPARWTEGTLENLATVAAAAVRWVRATYGIEIPTLTISKHAAVNGQAGFIAHGTLDPGRRSDPGATFPWGRFLSKTSAKLGALLPPNGEWQMSAEAERMVAEVHAALFDGNASYGVDPLRDAILKTYHDIKGSTVFGENTIRHYIRDQDRATRRVIKEAIDEACKGGPDGPLNVSPADRAAIADAVADELQERLRD